MAKLGSKDKAFGSIISIDPNSLKAYKYDNNELNVYRADKFIKNNFYISYLSAKDVINTQVEISKSIPDEDIKDAVELKVYDELGLDPAVEYKIIYIEDNDNSSKERVFDVYVIKLEKLSSNFVDIIGKVKYVDYITPSFFLPKALYNRNLLESETIDCFIYFQKDDAFLSIYENGEHLYSKSLRYSLEVIYEKFCELMGERVDEDDFFNLITNEGLKSSNITHQQYLMKLFGEIFLYINDVIVFAKRLYKIEHIDKIFIGSQAGQIVGVEEYSKNYLGVESKEFNFSIAINTREWYVDQIQVMMILTAIDYLENQEEKLNLSIIKRPPPFLKRASGQIITAFVASLILSFAYPGYQMVAAYLLDIHANKLNSDFLVMNEEANKLRVANTKLDKEIAKMKKRKKEQTDKLNYREKILHEIHNKKVKYNLKAEISRELFSFLNANRVKINKIVGDRDKGYLLFLKAKEDRYITQLIKSLVKLKKYRVHTDKIENVEPDTKPKEGIIDKYIYRSKLKLELKWVQ